MTAVLRKSPIHLGFDHEEERQEARIGEFIAQTQRPGDVFFSISRQRRRVSFYRRREGTWAGFKKKLREEARPEAFINKIPIPITGRNRDAMELQRAQIELHELLDLLPYFNRQEAIRAVLSRSDREIKRVGKKIREILPKGKLDGE